MASSAVEAALAELQTFLGDRATASMIHRMSYSRDWSPRFKDMADFPDLVVVPHNTGEVERIVQVALKHNLPVIPFAGGTGMGGGVVAWKGGILVETKGMNKVLEVDASNMSVTVQAGITIWELNEHLAPHGLWLPHQPESKRACTIGASIGVDNDSTFGVRYGKILDCLTDVVVVTGRGEAVRLGHRKASFSSTGYNLMHLFVAGEGTLGVVTEATLRVVTLPKTREVRGWVFRTLIDGARALERTLASGVSVESAHLNCRQRLHFYTHAYRQKYGREPNVPDWAESILFLSFAGDDDVVDFGLNKARRIMEDEYKAELVTEQEIVEGYWDSKHRLAFVPFKQKWPDSQREKKFGSADVGVPIGRLEEMYHAFLEISARYEQQILGMTVYNESPNKVSPSISFAIFVDDSTEERVRNFYGYVREMSLKAIELEGTMSTYIGDGDRLGGFSEHEHGLGYQYMKDVKALFDPQNIMNPGKKFESRWIKA
ncbi:MAG TPA: FAD-binding oxidoreductase [Anaerolineae bacterium]|nr:FAD-binding oxidoreductase [Anaerolineae bacterium]